MVEKPEISPICGKNPAHAEIRVHKICVFLGRTVHTHGKITGWGKLLKKKPPPFRMTKRVSELYRKTENAVVPFRKRGSDISIRLVKVCWIENGMDIPLFMSHACSLFIC